MEDKILSPRWNDKKERDKQMEENVRFVIDNSKMNNLQIIGIPEGKG